MLHESPFRITFHDGAEIMLYARSAMDVILDAIYLYDKEVIDVERLRD